MCPSDPDDFASDFDLSGFDVEEFEGDEGAKEEVVIEGTAPDWDAIKVGDWVRAELQGVLSPVCQVIQIYTHRDGTFWATIRDEDGCETGLSAKGLVRAPEPQHKPNGKANGSPQQATNTPYVESKNSQSCKPTGCLHIRDVGDFVELPPPDERLLGNSFCKEFMSGLISPGGIGKTTLRLLQAVALTCNHIDKHGIGLSGERVYQRSKVLILSMEDSEKEICRRLWAMLMHHRIEPKEVKGWLFVDTPTGLKLAQTGKRKQRVKGELEALAREAIKQYGFDLVIFDPLVDAHELEENAAGDMNYVCGMLTKMAIDMNVAIDTPHHARKGATGPGDPDSGRGSTAIPAKSRLIYTLTVMGVDEANEFGIDPEERHFYLRLDSAKVNIAPPARKARWFKLVGVVLGNGTEKYPEGDFVQAMEVWTPPETWQGMEPDIIDAILVDIERGIEGHRYSNSSAAKERHAWRVVEKHCPDKDESECRAVIKAWIKSGTLYVDEYLDEERRAKAKGLFVKRSKTDEN
jgi:hypothetical protein